VSRTRRLRATVRNCTRDEGGPFEGRQSGASPSTTKRYCDWWGSRESALEDYAADDVVQIKFARLSAEGGWIRTVGPAHRYPGLFREGGEARVGREPLFDCGGTDGWIRIPPGKELRANHEVRSRVTVERAFLGDSDRSRHFFDHVSQSPRADPRSGFAPSLMPAPAGIKPAF